MSVIHKCDACKKPIVGARTTVNPATSYDHFEFCGKCAAPILATLKKYKLIAAV